MALTLALSFPSAVLAQTAGEAEKLIDQYVAAHSFASGGDTFFLYESSSYWSLMQYRGLSRSPVSVVTVSPVEQMNGVVWAGEFHFTATACRTLYDSNPLWTEWGTNCSEITAYGGKAVMQVRKKNGRWEWSPSPGQPTFGSWKSPTKAQVDAAAAKGSQDSKGEPLP